MQRPDYEELIEKYRQTYDAIPKEAMELDLRVTVKTIQALAKGKPVSPNQLAGVWDMPLEQVKKILEQGKAVGSAQLDSDGNLVGGVITLIPTSHRIRVGGNDLYAWCAFDAIEMAALLDKTAEIESSDPISGDDIRLTIAPDGVVAYHPKSTVVSVVSPDVGGAGPDSPRCSQMLFFASRSSAETWASEHPGVGILSVEEALQITQEFVSGPARRMGLTP